MEELHVLSTQGSLQLENLGAGILTSQEFAALLTAATERREVCSHRTRAVDCSLWQGRIAQLTAEQMLSHPCSPLSPF